mmetsp:Transcript_73030/g.117739  ORF Transcript_73030/g.117739 Transcript_73030/m.117739 type:complete len:252 (-) Transcript_73030:242-997(-)
MQPRLNSLPLRSCSSRARRTIQRRKLLSSGASRSDVTSPFACLWRIVSTARKVPKRNWRLTLPCKSYSNLPPASGFRPPRKDAELMSLISRAAQGVREKAVRRSSTPVSCRAARPCCHLLSTSSSGSSSSPESMVALLPPFFPPGPPWLVRCPRARRRATSSSPSESALSAASSACTQVFLSSRFRTSLLPAEPAGPSAVPSSSLRLSSCCSAACRFERLFFSASMVARRSHRSLCAAEAEAEASAPPLLG